MCGCCWKSEFSAGNFLVDHTDPALFGAPQCGSLQWLFLLYRVVVALFLLGSWIQDLVDETAYYLIYLTNWSFMLVILSAVLETVSAILLLVKTSGHSGGAYKYKSMPVFLKITWFVHNVSNSGAFVVTILYWGILYFPGITSLTFTTVVTHGINSVYVFINLWITGIPIRLLHFWHPFVFGFVYSVFTLVYYAAGGVNAGGQPYIYSILDWGSNPGLAAGLTLAAVFVLIPAAHFVCFLICKLRIMIYNRCGCSRTSSVAPTESIGLSDSQAGGKEGVDNEAFAHPFQGYQTFQEHEK